MPFCSFSLLDKSLEQFPYFCFRYPSFAASIINRAINMKTFISIVLAATSFAYAAALPSTYPPKQPDCFATDAGELVCPPGPP